MEGRAGLALVVSVLVHVAVILGLVDAAVQPPAPPDPPDHASLEIALARPPPAPARSGRGRAPAAVASRLGAAIRAPSPVDQAASRISATPASPSPSAGGGQGASRNTSSAAAPLPAAEAAADLRGLLRATVGCSHQDYLQLSEAERRSCDRKVADAVRDAPRLMVTPADKRQGYDVQAMADEARRRRREAPLGEPVVPCEGPGTNLGAACLPSEAIHPVH